MGPTADCRDVWRWVYGTISYGCAEEPRVPAHFVSIEFPEPVQSVNDNTVQCSENASTGWRYDMLGEEVVLYDNLQGIHSVALMDRAASGVYLCRLSGESGVLHAK
jgi:hypothetical protein